MVRWRTIDIREDGGCSRDGAKNSMTDALSPLSSYVLSLETGMKSWMYRIVPPPFSAGAAVASE